MTIPELVRSYLQGKLNRAGFIDGLIALGTDPEAATGYAQVLDATEGRLTAAPNDAADVPDLTPEELRTLEAMAARIMPTSDTPGAAEAGAANYVAQALADAYRPDLPAYHRGLAALNELCGQTYGAAFPGLTAAQQGAVLQDLEAGKGGDSAFFQLVRRHVLEGMFCEPQYGGNRDLVGWRLVGFPGQRYGYSDPYIDRVVDLPPVAVAGPPTPEAQA